MNCNSAGSAFVTEPRTEEGCKRASCRVCPTDFHGCLTIGSENAASSFSRSAQRGTGKAGAAHRVRRDQASSAAETAAMETLHCRRVCTGEPGWPSAAPRAAPSPLRQQTLCPQLNQATPRFAAPRDIAKLPIFWHCVCCFGDTVSCQEKYLTVFIKKSGTARAI